MNKFLDVSIMKNEFYEISDPTQDVPKGESSWVEQLKKDNVICNCCSFIRREAIDIHLEGSIKKKYAPFTYVSGTYIGMLKNELALLLGIKNIENVYHIGKVYDGNGNLSKDYISLVPKIEIFIRGEKESSCRICNECKSVLYFPLPLNNWYITENSIPNLILFPSNLNSIIVNRQLFNQVKESGIKKIGYEKLLIREKAMDSYDHYF